MASAPINIGSSGTIVAGVAGKKIREFGLAAVSLAATGIKLQSNATDLTGTLSFAAKGGVVWPAGTNVPWCETAPGEALNINMTVGTTLGGVLIYDVV